MVAAAIIGSSVIGAGSNLIGGLTSSSAASSSAAAQQRQLNQVLQYQQGILNAAIPMAQDLQNQNVAALYGGQTNAAEAISNALGYGANALGQYLPQQVGAIGDWANQGLDALRAIAANVPGEIRGGVNSALDLLSGAGTNITNLLQPYATAGSNAIGELWSEINGTSPVPGQTGALGAVPNITDPSQLPGYQFALQQGENAAKNQGSASGYAGVGGNLSGPLGKSLATFAEGLANSNYTQYLQNYWANQNNRYGILAGLAGTGGQIGSNLGQILAGLGTAGASTALSGSVDMSQILTALAGNIGNIASTAGSNIGAAYGNVGNALAQLFQNIGTNLGNVYTGTAQNVVGGLTQPMQILGQIASGTSTNVGNAGVTGAANVGQATQNAGNLLGGSIQGTGGLLGNALLTNQLLNNSGSTIANTYPNLTAQSIANAGAGSTIGFNQAMGF